MRARVLPFGTTDGRTDEVLLAACASGDAAALAVLFDRYARPVSRFLTRFLGDVSELDDLVQGTFIQVWRGAGRFRGGSAVRVWIFGVAYNLARRHVRGRGRRRAFLELFATAPAAPERPLDDLLNQRQMVERVVGALGDLSPDQRVAVVMVDLEGIASVEAARALGVRPGTFGRRLFEARRRLRDAVAEVTP